MIIEEVKNIKSTQKDLRNFAVTIGVALCVIGLLILLIKKNLSIEYFIIGIMIISTGYIYPRVLLPFQKLWMILSIILGWISTRLILSVLFYFVLFPIRIIARLCGKKFLELEIHSDRNSYWNYRSKKEINPLDYERQF